MRGQIHEAFRALEKAARLNPANAEAQFRLAIWFFGLMLTAEAAPRFEKVATLRPVDALALDYLALSREALGEAEGAEAAYRSALKVNEGAFFDSFLDYNYGRFLLKQMRLEESRSHLDRAVALMAIADARVRILMARDADSLNVAVAAAIGLHALRPPSSSR